jgi:hypothetical protein
MYSLYSHTLQIWTKAENNGRKAEITKIRFLLSAARDLKTEGIRKNYTIILQLNFQIT